MHITNSLKKSTSEAACNLLLMNLHLFLLMIATAPVHDTETLLCWLHNKPQESLPYFCQMPQPSEQLRITRGHREPSEGLRVWSDKSGFAEQKPVFFCQRSPIGFRQTKISCSECHPEVPPVTQKWISFDGDKGPLTYRITHYPQQLSLPWNNTQCMEADQKMHGQREGPFKPGLLSSQH